MKRATLILSLIASLVFVLALTVPAFAQEANENSDEGAEGYWVELAMDEWVDQINWYQSIIGQSYLGGYIGEFKLVSGEWYTNTSYFYDPIDYLYVSGGLEKDGGYEGGDYDYDYDCLGVYAAYITDEIPLQEWHEWNSYAYHYYEEDGSYDQGWSDTGKNGDSYGW